MQTPVCFSVPELEMNFCVHPLPQPRKTTKHKQTKSIILHLDRSTASTHFQRGHFEWVPSCGNCTSTTLSFTFASATDVRFTAMHSWTGLPQAKTLNNLMRKCQRERTSRSQHQAKTLNNLMRKFQRERTSRSQPQAKTGTIP